MALHIADGLLFGALVGHLEEDFPHAPVVVAAGLERFHPEVGDTHRHAEVEADAALFHGESHAGHSAHVFGDGGGRRVDFAHQPVGEREVCEGVLIDVPVEILGVFHEIHSETVVEVAHAGHAVEAEAVEAELLEPVFEVGEQETDGFGLAVVEAARIPHLVVPFLAVMRV